MIGGCFATVWKASSVMVYPLCRFSSRVAGWVAKPVVASLFLLLLLYVSFVAVCWVCSSFSVFLFRLSLVLLGRSSPVWQLQEMFVNCFLLNEIRAKARSRKNKVNKRKYWPSYTSTVLLNMFNQSLTSKGQHKKRRPVCLPFRQNMRLGCLPWRHLTKDSCFTPPKCHPPCRQEKQ